MKGVVLAGGLGSRLLPMTKITNKHLLPVYDQPMIYYPIQMLVAAGITDIVLVTGGPHAGDFLRLLGNGEQFGLTHLNYVYQEGEGGIAAALALVETCVGKDKMCVVLGDNLIADDIRDYVDLFDVQPAGAKLLLSHVADPQRFGVPTIQQGRIVAIDEKPLRPRSSYAVTGIYFYDAHVFDVIKNLKPSSRGELEITDVNNDYIQRNELTWHLLSGWWTDAGTIESLYRASSLVQATRRRVNRLDGQG